MMTVDLLIRRKKDFYRYETDSGEIAIVPLQGERRATKLNRVATQIWELCDGEHTLEQILHMLQTCYPNISRQRLEEDVTRLLNNFEEKGLVIIGFNPLHPLLFEKGKLMPPPQPAAD